MEAVKDPMRLWILPLLVLLAGCAVQHPGAPPPPPLPLLEPIPPEPSSILNLPVQVDLDFARDRILQSLPKPLSQGVVQRKVTLANVPFAPEVGVEFRHSAQLENLDLRMDGDQFQAVARVAFSAGGSLVGSGMAFGVASCGEAAGEPLPAVDFTLRGTLSWKDEGEVQFLPLPWELKWVRPCELTAFKVRLEDVLELPLVRDRVEAAITQAVKRIPEAIRIRPLADQVWHQLQTPRLVLPGIWLVVRPESLSLGPLSGSGKVLETTVSLRARPALTDSVRASDTGRILPPLRVEATADGDFHLDAQASVPERTIDSLLTATLSGRDFDAGGRVVRISGARLYGGGDKAILGLTLVEPIQGDIFLRGRPEYDSSAKTLRLADLEFDLQTRSYLAKTADFLLHGKILYALRKAAAVDLRRFLPQLADLRIPAGEAGEVRVSLQDLKPVGLSLEGGRLQAWLRAQGRAVVKVGPVRR
jgi:hypothetical protein